MPKLLDRPEPGPNDDFSPKKNPPTKFSHYTLDDLLDERNYLKKQNLDYSHIDNELLLRYNH